MSGEQLCTFFDDVCARCQPVRDAFATDGETTVWNKAASRRSKCTSSLAANVQKFKDRKSRGWERQSPTLPVCPSANHTLDTFTLINVSRLWALHDEGIWNIACVLSGKILGTAEEGKDLRKWRFAARAHRWSLVEVGSP